jgi:hypothetical protein
MNGRLFLLSTNLTTKDEVWPKRACHLVIGILLALRTCRAEVMGVELHGRGYKPPLDLP